MVSIFHGKKADMHRAFQAWRQANVDGFDMTEGRSGHFTIHYAQDRRESPTGRGCMHQGCSDNDYLADKEACYTTAQKVCSNSLPELIDWATARHFKTKSCKHCDTRRFPFPPNSQHS